MAGLPGTGKTELSKPLASRLGGIVLSKDKVRAPLFPSGAINYASDQKNDFCMSVILMAAQRIAAKDNVPFVFFDGRTFSRRRQVEEVIRAAAEVNADYRILHLSCPDEGALVRIRQGQGNHLAADRDRNLYGKVKARFEPIMPAKLDVDTSRSLEESVEQCVADLKQPRSHRGIEKIRSKKIRVGACPEQSRRVPLW